MQKFIRNVARSAALGALVMAFASAEAQTPAVDPTVRLREVLPADVADRVIARIAAARAVELPTQALENRALKFAARGVVPAEIERAVDAHASRLAASRDAIRGGRPAKLPESDEIEAGAEALRQGVDGTAVSELAKSAPSGRSLAVPLFVIGSLVERGLPSDAALARVHERMLARATDAELERLPGEMGRGRPEGTPTDRARGTTARPDNVPASPRRPDTPNPRRP